MRTSRAVPPYLSQKLTRPLVTKDGGTPRAVKDVRASASNSAFAVSSSQTSRPSGRLKRKVMV